MGDRRTLRLSGTDRAVIRCIADGLTYRETARRLGGGMTEDAVKGRLAEIRRPRGAINTAHLIAILARSGDLTSDDAPPDGSLIGRGGDWWDGYRTGVEASHAERCDAVAAERDLLRDSVERGNRIAEQRIGDLQAEHERHVRALERRLPASA